jgi:hypothetical protein
MTIVHVFTGCSLGDLAKAFLKSVARFQADAQEQLQEIRLLFSTKDQVMKFTTCLSEAAEKEEQQVAYGGWLRGNRVIHSYDKHA